MVERPVSEGLFAAVRRHIWLAVLCAVLVPAAAYGLSKTITPEYTASSTLLFREPPLRQNLAGDPFVIRDPEARREQLTNAELASLDTIAHQTARRLRGGITAGEVSRDVEMSVNGNSDIAVVRAMAGSGELAARLANAFSREFIAFRHRADVRRIQPAQQRIQRQIQLLNSPSVKANLSRSDRLDRLRTLQGQARALEVLASVRTSTAEIVQPATVPASPSSPKTRTNVAVGGALGLLLGLSLAFFVDRFDRRVRSPGHAGRVFDLPVIGWIPRGLGLSSKKDRLQPPPAAAVEAVRSLRAGLRHANGGRDPRSILITSPGPRDGRTTTAWQLAAAAAEAGTRVLLLEADLRHPRLAQLLDLRDDGSLVEAVMNRRDLSRDVQRVALDDEGRWRSNGDGPEQGVDVLPAGPPLPDPSLLLASERMRQLLLVAKDRYGLVIIDTPPLLAVADAVPLLAEAGGVLIVLRIGHTRREHADRLADRLLHLRLRPLGVVVTNTDMAQALSSSYAEPYSARKAIPA
jgi:capsular exopolysaccharide synthesis family protein